MIWKSISLTFLLSFVILITQGQSTYYSSYSNSTGSIYKSTSVLTKAIDGTYVGFTEDYQSANLYSIYKITESGTIIWSKQVTIPLPSFSCIRSISLTDSSIAFLIASNLFSAMILNISIQGNVRWCKSYSAISSNFLSIIEPALDGGMVLAGAGCLGNDMDVRLNNNGVIISAKTHSQLFSTASFHPFDMVSEGNSKYTKWGCTISSTLWSLFLCDVDSLGENNNFQVIQLSGDTAYGAIPFPSRGISKSSSGGYYTMCAVADTTYNLKGTFLFYFNNSKQLKWIRKISIPSFESYPNSINATSDNGCVISSQIEFSPYPPNSYWTESILFMKFDSTGAMEWNASPGDTSIYSWKVMQLRSVQPDNNGGWISAFNTHRGFLEIAHTDDRFNGFCNYNYLTPSISPVQFSVDSVQSISSHFSLVDSSYVIDQTDLPLTRVDQCISLNISDTDESTFEIYPNPASNFISISGSNYSIEIFDMVGRKAMSFNSGVNRIDISMLKNGIYIVKSILDNQEFSTSKLLIQH